MKKSMRILLGVAIAVVGLIVTLVIMSNMQDNNANQPIDPDDPGSALLPFVGVQEMNNILDNTSGEGHFVYIGRASCPACQRFEPVFKDLLEEMGQTMKYFEIDRLWEDERDAVGEVIERMGGISHVPSLAFIQNGETTIITGVDFLSTDNDETRESVMEFFDAHGGLN